MVKYWKAIPKPKAKTKSSIHTANILVSNNVCQPNQTVIAGTPKASHSAQISPSVQPAPQWLDPLPTMAA